MYITFLGNKIHQNKNNDNKINIIKDNFLQSNKCNIVDNSCIFFSIGLSGISNHRTYYKKNHFIVTPSPYSSCDTVRIMKNSVNYNNNTYYRPSKAKLLKHINDKLIFVPNRNWITNHNNNHILVLIPCCPGPKLHKSISSTIFEYIQLLLQIKKHSSRKILIRTHPKSSKRFVTYFTNAVQNLGTIHNVQLNRVYENVGTVVSPHLVDDQSRCNDGTRGERLASAGAVHSGRSVDYGCYVWVIRRCYEMSFCAVNVDHL
ncbi:hypothetical protein TetV_640 [Tetraselmis virus 1]|uniref:Uncharacterized protein n=1 Tax=Tetraselmis virus 1 TaxID=2060617 RepID=A0A2P0VPC8_9VIRU|nr:hypothetical protein QJ968_gp414 [Tetraselmis virus 1]AUF82722.1 hypothetical protein TetV_640 [Tetraselmis virus 1]